MRSDIKKEEMNDQALRNEDNLVHDFHERQLTGIPGKPNDHQYSERNEISNGTIEAGELTT